MSEIPVEPQATPPKRNTTLIVILAIFGGLLVCCVPIMAAILFPVFGQAKLAAQKTASLTNMKQIALGALQYAEENQEHLPAKEIWCDRLGSYVDESAWNAPVVGAVKPGEPRYDYAMLDTVGGRDMDSFQNPDLDILFFESGFSKKNQFGKFELLPDPPRYQKDGKGQALVAYANGSARAVPYEDLR